VIQESRSPTASTELQVGCPLAAAALIVLDFETDHIALTDGGNGGALERCGMHEHILAAVFRRDEAVPAWLIEKFNFSDDSRIWRSFPEIA